MLLVIIIIVIIIEMKEKASKNIYQKNKETIGNQTLQQKFNHRSKYVGSFPLRCCDPSKSVLERSSETLATKWENWSWCHNDLNLRDDVHRLC